MMDETSAVVNNEIREDRASDIERYLPQGYPRFLFQGTSLDNAQSAKGNGLGGGTLSTYIIDCFDSRFYREENGRLIVTTYTSDTFMAPHPSSGHPEYQYYRIREGTGLEREIAFTSVDTDGVLRGDGRLIKARTTCYVNPDQMGSLQIKPEQKEFIGLSLELIKGQLLGNFSEKELTKVEVMLRKYNLPDSAAGYAGRGVTLSMLYENHIPKGADLRYRYAIRQKEMAGILGLQVADFADLTTLEVAIKVAFPDEEVFFNRLASQFPGELSWDWKNIGESDSAIVKAILQQIYQKEVVDKIKVLLEDKDISYNKTLSLLGESIKGLERLKLEKSTQLSSN